MLINISMTFEGLLGNCVEIMTSRTKHHDSEELAQRKWDHVQMAQSARTPHDQVDQRFNYEPMFFIHPDQAATWPVTFLGHHFDFPFWISSMTGGGEGLGKINTNLARLCGEFNLGMGLGSCRPMLEKNSPSDFLMRKHLADRPLFANLGIAQIEHLLTQNKVSLIHEMVKSLEANGLIIHINPLQEWIQPGGDRYQLRPIEVLKRFLETTHYPVMVKEVGQGMGPRSLKALLELPIAGIEFGAYGGTNFSLLEGQRGESSPSKMDFIRVGHTAHEMVNILNALPSRGKEFIISGGINSMIDAYELKQKMKSPNVIGLASLLLGPATQSYEVLREHFLNLKESLLVAKDILVLKESTCKP